MLRALLVSTGAHVALLGFIGTIPMGGVASPLSGEDLPAVVAVDKVGRGISAIPVSFEAPPPVDIEPETPLVPVAPIIEPTKPKPKPKREKRVHPNRSPVREAVTSPELGRAVHPVPEDLHGSGGRIGDRDLAGGGDYLSLVASWIDRHKVYPHRARDRGIEGRVDVRVTINPSGEVTDYSIERSDSALLAEGVQGIIDRANPFPKPPQQQVVSFKIPIVFDLYS